MTDSYGEYLKHHAKQQREAKIKLEALKPILSEFKKLSSRVDELTEQIESEIHECYQIINSVPID